MTTSSGGSASERARGDALDALIAVAADGRVVELDPGARRMLGVHGVEPAGAPVAALVARAGARGLRSPELGRLLSQRPSRLVGRRLEVAAARPDGSPVTIEVAVARTSINPGRFSIWLRDISDRKAIEADAIRNHALLARAEQLAAIGSWDWAVPTGELRWSDNLYRLFGVEPGEITPSFEYVESRTHSDDRERTRRALEAVSRTGDAEGPLDCRIVNADGSVRHLRSSVADVAERDGAPQRVVGVVQDVTEQRRSAREIAAHIAVAEALAAWERFDDGHTELLRALGEPLGYAIGVLWLPRDDGFEARAVWTPGAADVSAFAQATTGLRLRGAGHLPGRAASARRPVGIVSVQQDPDGIDPRRRDAALAARLRGALALPAVHMRDVLAVLEFYSHDARDLPERLRRSLAGIGSELGDFLARHRGALQAGPLTRRELEVLRLAAEGMSRKPIAAQLGVSPATVKTHFENIYARWGVSDRTAAVAKALRQGLIE